MDTATFVTIAIPTVTVMFGILLNRQDAISIRAEMKASNNELRTEMKSDNTQLRAEVKSEIGQLRLEMVQLRNSIHSDMVSLHERVAIVEAKNR